MTKDVEIKLVSLFGYFRRTCTICGGVTEKVLGNAVGECEHGEILVCELCLKAGDIDARLAEHADALEERAKHLRGLIGRLDGVPSYQSWEAFNERLEVAGEAARVAESDGNAVYDAVMADDDVYEKYRKEFLLSREEQEKTGERLRSIPRDTSGDVIEF